MAAHDNIPPSTTDTTTDLLHSPAASLGSDGCSPTEAKTKTPLKNTSRERRKAEKQLLSQQIVELEQLLSQLLAQRAVARCTNPSRVWRNIARRQLARRAKAEDENQRLKAKLQCQLQVAKKLEAVLRTHEGTLVDNDVPCSIPPPSKYPVHDLAALHEQCMDDIDQLYLQVDEVFDDASRSHAFGQQPLRRKRIVEAETGNEKLVVDLYDTAYAPFAYERVCNATWRAITTEYAHQNRVIEQFCCTDDEYTSKFWMPHVTSGQEADGHCFSATMTMRKFSEQTRMVLVWHGLDIKETAAGSSVYSSESGWLVAERASNPVTGEPCEDGTVVRVCTRYTPTTEANPMGSASLLFRQASETDYQAIVDPRDFTNRLLMCTEADIASITEAIENILLDEAIGSSDEDLEAVVGALEEALGC